MSENIFIPELWDNKSTKTLKVQVATTKIITSNKYKFYILHSISKETSVFIVSCQLKHKDGYWVNIFSSSVGHKGGLVAVDFYPDYRTQTLGDDVVTPEKFYLSDEDKVYQNMGDIVLYIEKGSSSLTNYHEYIEPNFWIKVKVVYLLY
jgi:hypothetical protein